MKSRASIAIAVGLLLTAGSAFGALDLTVSIDGSGGADYSGTDAVKQALMAIEADGTPDNSTITILDSAVYEAELMTKDTGIVITVAAGQAPTLKGVDGKTGIELGMNYAGTGGWGTLQIIGDSPTNKLTVIGPDDGGMVLNSHSNQTGSRFENIAFEPGASNNWAGCRLGKNEAFVNCSFGAGAPFSDYPIFFGGFSAPTFNDCSIRCNGLALGLSWHGTPDEVYTGIFTDCTITCGGSVANPGQATTNLLFDNLTMSAGDYAFWLSAGQTVTIRNSTLDDDKWCLGMLTQATFNLENCIIKNRRIQSVSYGNEADGVTGTGVHINVDRCVFSDGAFIDNGEEAASTAERTVTATNSIFIGDGTMGTLVNGYSGGNGLPNVVTLEHCTFMGATADTLVAVADGTLNVNRTIFDSSEAANFAIWHTAIDGVWNVFWDGAGGDGTTSGIVTPGDNIIADPLLDATGHLMEGSPALQAAVGSTLDIDVDGEARPQPAATTNDVGADESGAALPLSISRVTPANPAIEWGDSVTFIVNVANPVGSYTVEWFFDDGTGAVAIPNSDALMLAVIDATEADVGTYYCVVTDEEGSLQGPSFTLQLLTGLPVQGWPLLLVLPVAAVLALRRRQVRSH